LLSGEYAGVVQTRSPSEAPKARVSFAVYGGPLSESHSIRMRSASSGGAKSALDRLGHQVAHQVTVGSPSFSRHLVGPASCVIVFWMSKCTQFVWPGLVQGGPSTAVNANLDGAAKG
jgi:hypothetical protein